MVVVPPPSMPNGPGAVALRTSGGFEFAGSAGPAPAIGAAVTATGSESATFDVRGTLTDGAASLGAGGWLRRPVGLLWVGGRLGAVVGSGTLGARGLGASAFDNPFAGPSLDLQGGFRADEGWSLAGSVGGEYTVALAPSTTEDGVFVARVDGQWLRADLRLEAPVGGVVYAVVDAGVDTFPGAWATLPRLSAGVVIPFRAPVE